jgi:hypothetical protein
MEFIERDLPELSDEQVLSLKAQLEDRQKISDFNIREYPVEVITEKFLTDLKDEDVLGGELYIPDYQREMAWTETNQSRFIESILMYLPIPYIFVADSGSEGYLEIVDGSQRVRTLARFVTNQLQLKGLEILTEFNDLYISQLPSGIKRRFMRQTIRLIELTNKMDDEGKRHMFDRLNSGGVNLREMEVRRGVLHGDFLSLLEDLAKNERFKYLCPLSDQRLKVKDDLELLLRFFAYSERYTKFKHSVDPFLNEFIKDKNKDGIDPIAMINDFNRMLDFAEKLPHGFRKNSTNKSVPRIRFETLAVGIHLALNENPNLELHDMDWLNSDEFAVHTKSDASNSRPKLINRIHFVRDNLLNREVEYEGEFFMTSNVRSIRSKNVEPNTKQGSLIF